jgi:ankyrin repeat protein
MFSKIKDKFQELTQAVRQGNIGTIKNILANNKDLLIRKDDQDQMPIHIAAAEGQKEVVDLFIQADQTQLTARGREGRTPLWTAALNDQKDVAVLLLTIYKDDPNQINAPTGLTPLQIALKKRSFETASTLLENGATASEDELALIKKHAKPGATNKVS